MRFFWVVLVVFAGLVGGPAEKRVEAPQGSDREVFNTRRRHEQVPLPFEEALRWAVVARDLGNSEAERLFLERAAASPEIGEVAQVRLASLLVASDVERAVRLAVPLMSGGTTAEIRSEAARLAESGLSAGLGPDSKALVEGEVRRLSRSARRPFEVGLADPRSREGRKRLRQVLERGRGDAASLGAARKLQASGAMEPRDRWLVAQTLYRHALYREAIPLLERVIAADGGTVDRSKACFLRGRCAFRLDRWEAAQQWYRKALVLARSRSARADLEIHLARTLELAGRLDEAAEMARKAVVTETSDERRLLLIRMRLAQGRRDLAAIGSSRLRGGVARSRARVLIGLQHIGTGDFEQGISMLQSVRYRPWRGPALVVAADELASNGQFHRALELLETAAPRLDAFWAGQARRVLTTVPEPVVTAWFQQTEEGLEDGNRALGALRVLSVLEFRETSLPGIRARVIKQRSTTPVDPPPSITGLAGRLVAIGLEREAVRWDPKGFPIGSPEAILWTTDHFLDAGSPSRSIRLADAAWRRWGSDLPVRAYPEALQRAFFPLPWADDVKKTSERAEVDWAVVAGVAREESRWDPTVVSRVGARGLMQLMPLTAARAAEEFGVAMEAPGDLFDPRLSLELGAAELGRLHRAFDGFGPAAVAAYNAGEAQTRLWLEQCGQGCDDARFVLTISFDATRSYTAQVLASAEVYRSITERTE